jgi:hypothetical protein
MSDGLTSDLKLAQLFGNQTGMALTPITGQSNRLCLRIETHVDGLPVQSKTILRQGGAYYTANSPPDLWNIATNSSLVGHGGSYSGGTTGFIIGTDGTMLAEYTGGVFAGPSAQLPGMITCGEGIVFANTGQHRYGVNLLGSFGASSVTEASNTAPTLRLPAPAVWLENALGSVQGLSQNTECVSPPQTSAIEHAKALVRICAAFDVPEPSVDCDDEGNIEIFVKNGEMGLLFVVTQTGTLHVFGNSSGDKWRARYVLSGITWSQHINNFLISLQDGQSAT